MIFCGIVLEVSVLNDDEVAAGLADSAPQGCALPHILGLQENFDLRMCRLQLRQDLTRTILRTVIHTAQFNIERDGEHTLDNRAQGGTLVVNRHDGRKLHGVCAEQQCMTPAASQSWTANGFLAASQQQKNLWSPRGLIAVCLANQ